MASVLSRSSLRLLWLPKQPLELSLVKQSSAASAANQKYLSDLDSIKQVRAACLNCRDNCLPGWDLEDGAGDHHRAGRLRPGGGQAGRDAELLFQQLPRPLQPPGGRGGRGPGAQDARGGGVLGQVRGGAEVMGSTHLLMPLQIHLRHAGHTQGAGAENIKIPRAGGLYPVPLVFRRQRRAVRADLRARGRHPLGRAQPRLHH